MRRLVVGFMLAAVLAGCGSDGRPSGSSDTPLRDSSDALSSEGRDADGYPIKEGAIGGDPVNLNGLKVTIVSVGTPVLAEDRRSVEVLVRASNTSNDEIDSPEVLMTCAGEDQSFFADSTFDTAKPIPAGSQREGTRVLELPEVCEDATIVARFNVREDDDPSGHWRIAS
jgi:hypothetical protein